MSVPVVDHVPRTRLAEHHRMYREHAQLLARLALDTGEPLPPTNQTKLPGDPRHLRGIPVVGCPGGLGGAIPGTRPTDAIHSMP